MKVQVKTSNKEIHSFRNVTSVYIENNYLIIETKKGKITTLKPFDLSIVLYWLHEGEKKQIEKYK